MDELFEILSWSQLGLHQKPIGLLNLNGFYDHLLKQLDVMVEEGFLKVENRNLVIVSDSIDGLLQKMNDFKPFFHEKWLNREQI
jgi:predicted Rossmann-fold nucleotide-binding protein